MTARFGYNRLYQPTFVGDHNVPASQYGLDTGVTNPLYGGLHPVFRSRISMCSLRKLGGFNWPKVQGPDTRFQSSNHVSYTRGQSRPFGLGGETSIAMHSWARDMAALEAGIKFGFGWRNPALWYRGLLCGPFVACHLIGRRSHPAYS